MTEIQISELSNFININLLDIFSERKKENILKKYLSLYLNLSNSDILLNKSIPWSGKNKAKLRDHLTQINKGEPIQYVIKKEFFYNYILKVTEDVLIPRPETEELVSNIINIEKLNKKLKILEIGTGSGCIAITLKKNLIKPSVTSLDISKKAIEIAKENASLLKIDINFVCKDFFHFSTKEKFDIIVSNPPYIPLKDKKFVDSVVYKNEPHKALFVEDDPLIFYKKILSFSTNYLNKNGRVYFEINDIYKDDMKKYLDLFYSNIKYEFVKDMQNKYRFLFLNF